MQEERPDPIVYPIITRGECDQAQKNGNFILYAVTHALTSPQSHRFSGPEVLAKFELVPLQYKTVYKKI
jgi:hypothetical protein